MCFTGITPLHHTRHLTDPVSAVPKFPGFGCSFAAHPVSVLPAAGGPEPTPLLGRGCPGTAARGAVSHKTPSRRALWSGDASPVVQQHRRVTFPRDVFSLRTTPRKTSSDPKRRETTGDEACAPPALPERRGTGQSPARAGWGRPRAARDATDERSRRAPAAAPARAPRGQQPLTGCAPASAGHGPAPHTPVAQPPLAAAPLQRGAGSAVRSPFPAKHEET